MNLQTIPSKYALCANIKSTILRSKYNLFVVYQGTSNADSNTKYIGETKFITTHRWEQHNTRTYDSSPAKYLREQPGDSFSWEVLSRTPMNANTLQIQEALFIMKFKPILNQQISIKKEIYSKMV